MGVNRCGRRGHSLRHGADHDRQLGGESPGEAAAFGQGAAYAVVLDLESDACCLPV